jgi:hypothetical protein
MGRGSVLISRLLPGKKVASVAHTWHGCHAAHGGVIVVQTEARGETGATLERMGGEKGILPERSEWFRSRRIIGTAEGGCVENRLYVN